MLGVRWDESQKRKSRGVHETIEKYKKNKIVFVDENDDRRKLTEICQMRNMVATNPIIDWLDEEIWAYIEQNKIPMNPLYKLDFKRVGCVGCPFAGYKGQLKMFEFFPKYKKLYINAFEKMLEYKKIRGLNINKNWVSGEAVYRWWTDPTYNPNQMTLIDFDEE
jgi:phosphoadenosine phosphosulfate reductase